MTYKPDLNYLNNDWNIVSYKKKKKEMSEKKNLLESEIELFINKIEYRDDFVYMLLKDNSLFPSKYYDDLSLEIDRYKILVRKLKKSKDLNYFNKKKDQILMSIKNMNKIINPENLHILIGEGLIEDNDGILLKDLDKYKFYLDKYNKECDLKNKSAHKVPVVPSSDISSISQSFVSSEKTFASLFK